MDGRLTINIISSERAGESLSSADRYRRTGEAMSLLRSFWTDDHVAPRGRVVELRPGHRSRPAPEPRRSMYFGGHVRAEARDVAAEHADCYLMWIESVASTAGSSADLARAGRRPTAAGCASGCAPT